MFSPRVLVTLLLGDLPCFRTMFLSRTPSHREVGIADSIAQKDKPRLSEGRRRALRHTAEPGHEPRPSDAEVRGAVG